MIKKIVFDLDNTLINWEDEYWNNAIIKVCNQFKIPYSDEIKEKIVKAIDNYENNNEYFNVDIMQDLINKELKMNLGTYFIKEILKYFEKCVPKEIDSKVINTLEYLKEKYELVVLTNWFENQQIKRLENVGLIKYFKNVYGAESIKMKPNKEAFLKAIGNFRPNECIMIGDNLKIDIDGAISVGMSAIFLNRKNITVDKKYNVIESINELIEIL